MRQDLVEFNRSLQKYLQYNKRDLGPLIENRGRRIQWALYRQFRDIAPTPGKIMQDAKSRQYRIKRRKGKSGKKLSLKQELAVRRRSVKWLSVSFLIRNWKAKREGQAAAYHAVSRKKWKIGKAILRTAKGKSNPSVRIESYLEGAAIQNAQRGIVNRVISGETADMETYVARKQQEAFKRQFGRALNQLIRI